MERKDLKKYLKCSLKYSKKVFLLCNNRDKNYEKVI